MIIARRIMKRRYSQGAALETLLDMTALLVLLVSILVTGVLLVALPMAGYGLPALGILSGFVQWLLLRSLAEHLRLQKKIAGLRFEGRISGPMDETIWACSNCGQILHSDTRCDACGADIQTDPTQE